MTDTTPPFGFSERAGRTRPQPISYLMAQAVENPGLISLAAGLVDEQTLPAEPVRAQLERLLGDPAAARVALQYGTTEGLARLRHALLHHLASLDGSRPEDLNATADNIVVTNGSQQLLYILTDLLIDPGDIVITEWPSYFVYTNALHTTGATVRCVEMDEHGLVVESLDRLLGELAAEGQLHRVKMVYTCSCHQNPTGLTLSPERHEPLLRVIERYSAEHRILLIEDAAYRELTFDGPPPPSIKRADRENRFVALAQTLTKPFAPGLKIGYGLLPRDLVAPVAMQKGMHDFGSTNFNQHLLLAAMESGAFAEHVQRLREAYAAKCGAMLEALAAHVGPLDSGEEAVHWTRPGGGLYVWLTLPEHVDTSREGELFSRAIGEGVLYVPGPYCYPSDPTRTPPTNTLRLSFGVPTIEQIHTGIERLAAALRPLL